MEVSGSLMPRQLYQWEKESPLPTERLSGPKSLSGRFGEEINIMLTSEFELRFCRPSEHAYCVTLLPMDGCRHDGATCTVDGRAETLRTSGRLAGVRSR
jgi:hypothetical protein